MAGNLRELPGGRVRRVDQRAGAETATAAHGDQRALLPERSSSWIALVSRMVPVPPSG